MSFGLTIEKLFIIGLIAMLVVGPERLPRFAAQFARLVKRLREMARGAESRLRDEVGNDFDIAELKKLDPRQYDPRRIIRDAFTEELTPTPRRTASAKPAASGSTTATPESSKPFDGEAT